MKAVDSRFIYLDTVCGIMILYMIYGHYCAFVNTDNVLQWIMYPFMPWFFYKAGMFQRTNINVIDTFYKGVNRLIVPYVLFGMLSWFIVAILFFYNHDLHVNYLYGQITELLWVGAIWQNQPLWFLLSLFVVRIIYTFLLVHKLENLSFVGLLLAFFIFAIDLQLPFWCGNISLGLFFYWLGQKLVNLQFNKCVAVVSIMLFLILVFSYNSPGSFLENKSESIPHYIVYVFSSIFGVISFNNVFNLLPIIEKTKLYVIGKYSMALFVSHIVIFRIVEFILKSYNQNTDTSYYPIYFAILVIILLSIVSFCLTRSKLKGCIGM